MRRARPNWLLIVNGLVILLAVGVITASAARALYGPHFQPHWVKFD